MSSPAGYQRLASRYVEHVTLTTGHKRRSSRSEVSDEAIAICTEMLARLAIPNAAVPIPGAPGYLLRGRIASRCMVASVWNEGPSSTILATIGIAAHSRCGASLWRELHRWGVTPVVTDPDQPPPVPWVSAALDEGIVAHVDAAGWLGDFERCLAWAFLEEVGG